MLRTRLEIFVLIALFVIPSFSNAAQLINGAGATFPFPLYSKWFFEYQKVAPGVHINYQSIGSGGGIRQLLEHTVDFGATDIPMKENQLKQADKPILHIPMVLGAIAVTYNLPGVPSGLRISPDLLADIFLGKVSNWNDPKVAALNPQFPLPNTPIIVIRRSDGSGTSAVFTEYLSKISPEWKTKVGTGTSVNWPVGLGGKGNEGVAGLVKQTPGSLGYVELNFAENNHLPAAALQNAENEFISPSAESVRVAASASIQANSENLKISLTHARGKGAYPLSSFTYVLIYQEMPREKGKDLVQFIQWAITEGQNYTQKLHYISLPSSLGEPIQKALQKVSYR